MNVVRFLKNTFLQRTPLVAAAAFTASEKTKKKNRNSGTRSKATEKVKAQTDQKTKKSS